MEELATKTSREKWFLRINKNWIQTVHNHHQRNNQQRSNETRNYAQCLSALKNMYNPQQQQQQSSPQQCDSYLRTLVLNHVFDDNLPKETKIEIFPGPMANQLCRRDLHLLQVCYYYLFVIRLLLTHCVTL
jgi:hypothetical protein